MYYECLDKFDSEEDISSLRKFIKYEQEKTWERRKSLLNHLLNRWGII